MLYRLRAMDDDRETSQVISPKYDTSGLITAVITDATDGMVLMVGHMNAQALACTRDTGFVHFFSRSRQALWKKGETSGNLLLMREMLMDCDQDAVWVKATPVGPTCHTGRSSCFYRRVTGTGLEMI